MPRKTLKTAPTVQYYVKLGQSGSKLSRFLKAINGAFERELKSGELGKCLKIQTIKELTWQLSFCGEKRIQALNLEWRNKNKATDVLSFALFDNLRLDHISKHKQLRTRQKWDDLPPIVHLGDIFVSIPIAKKQAERFDISLEEEVAHLYTHGLLHLLGYDHEVSSQEEERMQYFEKRIISKAFKNMRNGHGRKSKNKT